MVNDDSNFVVIEQVGEEVLICSLKMEGFGVVQMDTLGYFTHHSLRWLVLSASKSVYVSSPPSSFRSFRWTVLQKPNTKM